VSRWLVLPTLVLTACLASEPGCPCGAAAEDPLAEHDPSFTGRHVVDDECVCRCGDGEPLARPREASCAVHEVDCVDPSGVSRRLTCY
jgi:hypothetical protein